MKIRREAPADAVAIEAVTIAAFKNAAHTEQFIASALRKASQLTVSMVAEDNGEVVGHVAISPVAVSSGAARWHGLGPISVAPERQGQGVGTRLMQHALARCAQPGAWCWEILAITRDSASRQGPC